MEKQKELVCVSDMEDFDRDLYEKSKETLSRHLSKFGWSFEDCVFEEGDKVYCCKPAAIWFLVPNVDPNDWD